MKHRRPSLLAVILLSFLLRTDIFAVPMLPESGLIWKNVAVDNKKTAVYSLFKDSRGLMWLGTNNGLHFYDGCHTHTLGDNGTPGVQIYAIAQHGDSLYIGSNNGLMIMDLNSGKPGETVADSPREIRCFCSDGDALWIGGLGGIYRYTFATGKTENLSAGLPNKSVYTIVRDSRGVLYAGTYNGLARFNNTTRRFAKVPSPVLGGSQRNIFVNSLIEARDGQSLYVGCERALYIYSPVSDTWSKSPHFNGENIKSLALTPDGTLVAGTDNGLVTLSGNSPVLYRHDSRNEQTLSDNEIWGLYCDDSNNIWAGHERGLSIAANSAGSRVVKLSSLAGNGEGNEVHVIHRDSNGSLWVGGTNGVIQMNSDGTRQWHRHNESTNSLSHNRIRAIHEDEQHNLWFATDGGINRYNKQSGNFSAFTVVDPRGEHNSNWVYSMSDFGHSYIIGSFLGGIHIIDKSKFGPTGATITSDISLNTDTRLHGAKSPLMANDLVNNVVTTPSGDMWILLFRDNTLLQLNMSTGKLRRYNVFDMTGNYPTNIEADSQGRVWCAFKGGVMVLDGSGEVRISRFPRTNSDETVLTMARVDNDMWISTQSNLWRVDGSSLKAEVIPLPQHSYTAIYHDKATDNVLLGGTDEILEVNRQALNEITDTRTIHLIKTGEGNDARLAAPLNALTEGFTLPYGGSLTLTVSTLDYSPDNTSRYTYCLEKSSDKNPAQWVILPEGANTINLTDLSMGSYKILIKPLGSPAAPLEIPIKVKAPASLSTWAILIYILIAAGIIAFIIWTVRRRNLATFRERERKKSLEAVEKKITFLSNISHDLKTPLSMILGPVSILKEKSKDPAERKSLETVYDNAVRLNNLIHRTLELNHIGDNDEDLLILSTFDAVEFCRSLVETFRDNNPKKNFVFHTSPTPLFIEADAVKFESVITNLLSNACKYSEDGATISCGVSRRDSTVEIVVSDDGIGIAESDQPLIFQRMFRAPASAKLHEGTGLGLYLVKKYLELMKGNIDLYSRKGQGTSFVVTLPITTQRVSKHPADESATDNSKPRVLIVEDNLQIAAFITDLLSAECNCLVAENGKSGLSLASSFGPDLIIADEMMPIMSGLEMCSLLKQNPRLAHVPIIMLTAKSDNTTETESVKVGVEVFMSKPFEPAVLMGRVRHILQSLRSLREKVRIEAITHPKPIEAESVTEKQLAKIAKVVEENVSDPELNVNELCEKTGIPNKQLYRIIKKHIGVSPLDYIRRVRLQKAAMLLSQHRFTVSEVTYMVGFKTPSYFAKCFQAEYGVKPSQYKSDDESSQNI
ncbi:MAG: ATP-binding protein [Bacteroides sp.]|nr:ATP-binding protein [Bacteroides sp.]